MKAFVKPTVGSWDLGDLVEDPHGNEFKKFLQTIKKNVMEFESRKCYLNDKISAFDFEDLLHMIEDITEKVSIASGYAHLRYAADTSSNEAASLVTRMDMLEAETANRILFFDIWFKKKVNERDADRLIQSVSPQYKEYLRHKRVLATHTLTEPEEKVISILDVTGTNALVKIYDRMTSSFEFVMTIKKGKKTMKRKFSNKEKMLSLIRSTKAEEREASYKSLWQVYKKNSGVIGEIYLNRVIKWHDEYVVMRGFASPITARNVYNNLDDTTVQALLEVCKRNSIIFRQYFKEKARMLGVKKLKRYHLYAPLPMKSGHQKRFTYSKSVDIVLKTFEDFDSQFRDFAERVFTERHVDSQIRNNKQGGAFCSSVSPKISPYVLLNFDGKVTDMSTMAHEFGHAIHSLAASNLPIIVSHAPLPLAETASVFAEMLLNDSLRKRLSSKERKISLAEQIDDMYATIMRQAYFTLFEVEAHKAIGDHNATIDKVAQLYLDNLSEQFGNSIDISADFQWEWLYIPHFYHTPFYCYAYSFGNLLVMSLYQQFKTEGKSFIPRYFKILQAGGSRKPEELLKDSGIDISNQQFWQQGFELVENKMKEFQDMTD
jgi:oligoendopeptidase F